MISMAPQIGVASADYWHREVLRDIRIKSDIGRYRIKMRFDEHSFPDGKNTTPRTFDLGVTIGDEQYPGSASLGPDDLRVFWNRWRCWRGG